MKKTAIAAGLVALGVIGVASATSSPAPETPIIEGFQNTTAVGIEVKTKAKVTSPKPTPQSTCNPNYSGCLKPDASDYDCAGGSGNGPYYTGPVRVLGYDQYDLDRDNDGWACE
jgi:hypothetical protein